MRLPYDGTVKNARSKYRNQITAVLKVPAEQRFDDAGLGGRIALLQGQGDELV